MRGRKPTPTSLKLIRGNPGKRPINRDEPDGGAPLKDAPGWLSETQVEIWNKGLEMAPAQVLKEIDESIFAVWVVAYDTYQRAAQKVARFGVMTKATPTSENMVQNPYLAVQNRQSEILLRAAAQMGFDPTSRTRLKVIDGVDPNDPWADL